MSTLSHLLDAVYQLPETELHPGVSPSERTNELQTLSPLIPNDYIQNKAVKRGCILREDKEREVLVRVFNGTIHNLCIVRAEDGSAEVRHNSVRVDITTTEDFRNYVVDLIDCDKPK